MHKHLPSREGKNIITNFAGAVFLIVGTLHLARIILGLDAYIGDWFVPMWFSWLIIFLTLYLSYSMFKMDK